MRIPLRIIAPVVLALCCVAVLVGFLWWQLRESAQDIQHTIETTGNDLPLRPTRTMEITPVAADGDEAIVRLRQGDLFALRGQWSEAQQEYQLAVDAGGDLPALRKLAQAQLQRRDMDGVRATIRDMKNAGAKSEDLLLLESIVHLRTGELVRAREVLEGAQDSPQQHYGLALLSMVEGSHEQAKQELAIVMNGWEPVLRANARSLQGAYDEFALFPESPEIHLVTLLSRALAQVQECELALPLLNQVTLQQDDYRDAWIVQGYCELATERPEQAIISLEQAYQLDPQKPETQYFLGRAYAASGDSMNAITFLEYALANGFQPEAEVRRELAAQALIAGNGVVAMEQYAALAQRDDATIETFEQLAQTSLALGETDRALLAGKAAAEKFPENARALLLLGTMLAATEDKDGARIAYQKALQLDPFLREAEEKLQELQ
jgi:tetratricopeptide (TPR) repeat protein